MSPVITVIVGILFFALMIVVHEAGHYFTAKALGVNVYEFSIGFGPLICQKDTGKEKISLRALPLGGYCAFRKKDQELQDGDFDLAPVWKKILILLVGPLANFIIGVLILFVCVVLYNWGKADFAEMCSKTGELVVELCTLIFDSIKSFIVGYYTPPPTPANPVPEPVPVTPSDLAGPVQVIQQATVIADTKLISTALYNLGYYGAFLAINLAILNLLPIPALDGGHIFTILVSAFIEKITGKPLDKKYENIIHLVGLVLLLTFSTYIMFHDIWTLITQYYAGT